MNTATIADFKAQHGLRAIVRRHAIYHKPKLPIDSNLMCALVYSRTIDPTQLGLTAEGATQMFRQGQLLTTMGLPVSLILSGIDLRNTQGARFTAEGIEKSIGVQVRCLASADVTYPYYHAGRALEAWQKFGDMAAHMYLAERPEVSNLWSESADAFETRITTAIQTEHWPSETVLFDLNFEQLTLLHYIHVEKIQRQDIPFDKSAWIPKNGGGIVYGNDGAVAEFNPDFTLV